MVRKRLFVGDMVTVHLGNGTQPFRGIVTEVNQEVSKDIWYKVKPDGEGVAQGRSFWHRENYVKKENSNERS